jgi:hypothetical protein
VPLDATERPPVLAAYRVAPPSWRCRLKVRSQAPHQGRSIEGWWSEAGFGTEATCARDPGLSSERLELDGPHGYRPGRPLLPSLDVDAYDEEPQAERSFT